MATPATVLPEMTLPARGQAAADRIVRGITVDADSIPAIRQAAVARGVGADVVALDHVES